MAEAKPIPTRRAKVKEVTRPRVERMKRARREVDGG